MLMATVYSFGQSFVIANPDTSMWGAVGSDLSGGATVKNVSGSSKTVKCRRTIIHQDAGNISYFCWGPQCYNDSTYVSPNPVAIAGGDSAYSFIGHCGDATLPGVNTVMYTFYTVGDTTDSASFIARYYFGPAGINELSAMGKLFNASPNPAIDNSTILYSLSNNVHSAQLIITNILGSKIAEYPLDTRNNTYLLYTKNLSNGVYFYSLEADGKMISTKKLLVSH